MTELTDWKNDDLITADRLNAMLSVIRTSSKEVKEVTFSDFTDIAKNPTNYQGYWYSANLNLANAPMGGWLLIKVTNARANAGLIEVYSTAYYQKKAWSTFGSGVLNGWYYDEVAGDTFYKSADNTVTGTTNFTGNVSIGGTAMNYGLVSSLSINGYVSGTFNVRKQSGLVSITSMDLVLAKGATLTLPSGYRPRSQMQAPITGQNSNGMTAGGYMTIGVDGAVVFNSMGFASGNATTYIDVNYIASNN